MRLAAPLVAPLVRTADSVGKLSRTIATALTQPWQVVDQAAQASAERVPRSKLEQEAQSAVQAVHRARARSDALQLQLLALRSEGQPVSMQLEQSVASAKTTLRQARTDAGSKLEDFAYAQSRAELESARAELEMNAGAQQQWRQSHPGRPIPREQSLALGQAQRKVLRAEAQLDLAARPVLAREARQQAADAARQASLMRGQVSAGNPARKIAEANAAVANVVAFVREIGVNQPQVKLPELDIPALTSVKHQNDADYRATLARVKQLPINYGTVSPQKIVAYQEALARMPITVDRMERLQQPADASKPGWRFGVPNKDFLSGHTDVGARSIEVSRGSFNNPVVAALVTAHEVSHGYQQDLLATAYANFRATPTTLEQTIRNELAAGYYNEGKALLDEYAAAAEYRLNSGKQPPPIPASTAERAAAVPVLRAYLDKTISRDEAIRRMTHVYFHVRGDTSAAEISKAAGKSPTAQSLEDVAILRASQDFDTTHPQDIREMAPGGKPPLLQFTMDDPSIALEPGASAATTTRSFGTVRPARGYDALSPIYGGNNGQAVLGYAARQDTDNARTWVVWDANGKVQQHAVTERLDNGTQRLLVFGRDASGKLVPVDGREVDRRARVQRLDAAHLQRIEATVERPADISTWGL